MRRREHLTMTVATEPSNGTSSIMRHALYSIVSCTLLLMSSVWAFVPQNALLHRQQYASRLFSSDKEIMESLRARQLELQNQEAARYENWKTAKCESSIPVALPDWVRRIDVNYPLVAAGSSSGTLFVCHAETGDILAQSQDAAQEQEELEDIESILRILFGPFDGGGTLAIAICGDLIISAGRQGSVQIHRYDKTSKLLLSQGSIKALEGLLVTSLQLDEEYAWIGTKDGRVLAYPHSDSLKPLSLQSEAAFEFTTPSKSSILSLSIDPSIGYGVFTTAQGSVELFSMDNDDHNNRILASWYPPFDNGVSRQSSNTYPLTATIVGTKDGGFRMACGASDGSLYLHPLKWENDLDILHPLDGDAIECQPKHQAPLNCLVSPKPGLLVSGGQDGAIRMWDVSEALCLYQFMGYKVWLGSLCTDGIRLISDGADNTIVVHNFESQQESSSDDNSSQKGSE